MFAENRVSGCEDMNVHVINFASPRPGNEKFRDRFQKNIVLSRRIVNAGDPVTTVPLDKVMGYKHVDNGLMFYPSGNGMNLVKFDSTNDPAHGGLGILNHSEAVVAS